MRSNITILVILCLYWVIPSSSQPNYDVVLLKDPITGKYGYANKEQNRNSPFRGLKKFGRNVLGSNIGSSLIGKSDADEIDWAIPPQYDAASKEFSEQLAAVEINGKVGYIDIYNRFIIEPRFAPRDDLDGFSLGLSAVRIGDKYGFINKKGEIVIEPTFDYAENFKENMLASVKQNGKYGAIDITGKLVVPCKYPLAAAMISTPLLNTDYREAAKTTKTRKENLEFTPITDQLDNYSKEIGTIINDTTWTQKLVVEKNGSTNLGLRDQYGRAIIPERFISIDYDSIYHLYVVCDTASLYGLYTYNGSRVFRPLFDSMGTFEDGHCDVSIRQLDGWIGPTGYIDPDFLDNLCNLGLAYDQAGDKAEAVQLYNRILLLDPDHVMTLNNLAIIDIDNKDYNKGMRKLKLAHKLAPDNELIENNLRQAKKNRTERRWNRVNSALEIAGAIVGVASATYTVVNGSQGMQAGGYTPTSGSSSMNSSTSTSQKSGKIKVTCVSCKGSGICKWCGGSGKDKNIKSGNCPSCHGSTKCKLCHGRGET